MRETIHEGLYKISQKTYNEKVSFLVKFHTIPPSSVIYLHYKSKLLPLVMVQPLARLQADVRSLSDTSGQIILCNVMIGNVIHRFLITYIVNQCFNH